MRYLNLSLSTLERIHLALLLLSLTISSNDIRISLTSAVMIIAAVVEIFADPDNEPISYYYGPFQTFSEKLPYVPSYLNLRRLSFTKSFFVDA